MDSLLDSGLTLLIWIIGLYLALPVVALALSIIGGIILICIAVPIGILLNIILSFIGIDRSK